MDQFGLLRLLSHALGHPSPVLEFENANASSTCYRRVIVGTSATLDFNIAVGHWVTLAQRQQAVRLVVDFVHAQHGLPAPPTADRKVPRPSVKVIHRSEHGHGRSTGRVLGNADELVQWGALWGLDVQLIDFGKMTQREVVQALSYTTILIGMHGAGFANILFLPPGAAAIMLQPTESFSYFPDFFVNLADAKGVAFFSHDIACCGPTTGAFIVAKELFRSWVGDGLLAGTNVFMPQTWDLSK